MTNRVAMLTAACVVVACPAWVSALPHHPRLRPHPHRSMTTLDDRQPFVLHVQSISYDHIENRPSSNREFAPGPVGAIDRIPLGAVNHFGRRGVASIGYQRGASRSSIEAHELNAAFSSQPIGFGGAVGGDVSLHF